LFCAERVKAAKTKANANILLIADTAILFVSYGIISMKNYFLNFLIIQPWERFLSTDTFEKYG
jgi:hypothetical protein